MRGFPVAFFLLAVLANMTLVGRLLINIGSVSSRTNADEENPNRPKESLRPPPIAATKEQLQPIRTRKDVGNRNGTSTKTIIPSDDDYHLDRTRPNDDDNVLSENSEPSSSYDAQSQDGIDHNHMGSDGAWVGDFPELLGCPIIDSDFAKSEDPMAYNYIPNKDSHWNHFIKAYHSAIDPNHDIIPFDQYNESAWGVPIEVRFSKKDGRGVYAKVDIPKGAKVWDADYHTAVFNTSHAYREFLEHLIADNATKRAACDCQIWIDVAPKPSNSDDNTMKQHKRKEYQICQTFDEAVLFNTREPKKQNLKAVDKDTSNPCGAYYYIASKDIKAGEQLLISYSTDGFGSSNGYAALGLS
ncbi:MAG: hypothetical protein SGILL_006640 [Bacillariaceae sp.]